MEMSERWECLSSESIELVSQELDLLCLLLDDVHKLALVSDLLDLLRGVLCTAIIPGLRFQTHDLFSLIHILLQLTGLSLQLLIFAQLVLYLLPELLLGLIDCLDPLLHVLVQLPYLVLEPLLILLILLLMLPLYYLLRLFRDSVHLHVLRTLLIVQYLQIELLLLIVHLPEEGLELRDLLHLLDLLVPALHNLLVLHLDHTALDEDRVLVVGGDGELRDFHLALLEVNDHLKVVLELRDTIGRLLVEGESFLEFTFDV